MKRIQLLVFTIILLFVAEPKTLAENDMRMNIGCAWGGSKALRKL